MHTPDAIEASFIFFPQPQLRGDPSHVGLHYEDVWLTADDGNKTHAWFIKGEESVDPEQRRILMLITHGNGGNISVRLDQYREFVDRYRFIDIFALEYRGYGLSEGSPSEEGIALDAIAARRWIDEYVDGLDHPPAPLDPRLCGNDVGARAPTIVYFGRSMGGSVATRLASVEQPDALILECPLLSIPYLAKTIVPWKYLPIERFIHNRFDTESYMREVRCPVLVMHSEFDEIIPIECGRMVYEAAKGPKRFYVIKGAPHNGADYYDPEGYYAAMGNFWVGSVTRRPRNRSPLRTGWVDQVLGGPGVRYRFPAACFPPATCRGACGLQEVQQYLAQDPSALRA